MGFRDRIKKMMTGGPVPTQPGPGAFSPDENKPEVNSTAELYELIRELSPRYWEKGDRFLKPEEYEINGQQVEVGLSTNDNEGQLGWTKGSIQFTAYVRNRSYGEDIFVYGRDDKLVEEMFSQSLTDKKDYGVGRLYADYKDGNLTIRPRGASGMFEDEATLESVRQHVEGLLNGTLEHKEELLAEISERMRPEREATQAQEEQERQKEMEIQEAQRKAILSSLDDTSPGQTIEEPAAGPEQSL